MKCGVNCQAPPPCLDAEFSEDALGHGSVDTGGVQQRDLDDLVLQRGGARDRAPALRLAPSVRVTPTPW